MATNKTVITAVLRKIFVLEGAEVAAAEDYAAAKAIFDSRLEYLRDRGIAWWDDDDIPLEAEDPLAEYMTHFVAPDFMVQDDYRQRSARGFADLSELSSAADDSGEPIQVTYF